MRLDKYSTPKTIALLLIFLMMATYILTIRDGHTWGGDFSMYIRHAMNIAYGEPYGETGYIVNPYNTKIAPKTYPVGYPLMLTPVIKVFGVNMWVMKYQLILLHGLAVSIFYKLIAFDKRNNLQLLTLFLLVLSPFYWNIKDDIMSDIPFSLLMLVYLVLLDQLSRKKGRIERVLLLQILAGVIMYAAFMTRSLGLVLFPVPWITDWIRQRRITKATLVASLVFAACAALGTLVSPSEANYLDILTISPADIVHNVGFYAYGVTCGWAVKIQEIPWAVFGGILGLFIMYGYVTNLRQYIKQADVFIILYMSVILVWPWRQWRFTLPILPFSINYFVEGFSRVVARIVPGRSQVKRILAIGVSLMLLVYGIQYRTLDLKIISEGITKPTAIALFDYIRTNTQESDVFVFFKPRVLALYTGRSALGPHVTDSDVGYWAYYDSIGVDYLITGLPRESYRRWDEFVVGAEDQLRTVYANQDFEVYEIEH